MDTTILAAVLLGAAVVAVYYLVVRGFKGGVATERQKGSKSKDDKSSAPTERKKESSQVGNKSKKQKLVDGRWSNRNEKQSYSHPWLLTSLKGHTGSILDMDFSGNGKYLVSCGEEDPDPGGALQSETSSTTSSTSSTNDSSSESSPKPNREPEPSPKGLSRRQKKNRRREEVPQMLLQQQQQRNPKQQQQQQQQELSNKKMAVVPLKQFVKFDNSERVFMGLLHNYLLTHDQMMSMGYPVKYLEQNLVAIYKSPRILVPKTTYFDVNARAFVPKNEQTDSGQGSGSSSDSGENFETSSNSGSTCSSSEEQQQQHQQQYQVKYNNGEECYARSCCRCNKLFYTNSTDYLTREKCTYHWGKLQTVHSPSNDKKHGQLAYSCCQGRSGSRGCAMGQVHVWSGLQYGMNGVYDDYVFTKPRKTPPPDGNYGVYALDCEMCYTVRGLEVTKVTVVGVDGRLVYDTYVRPDREIVDYNTRFSGVGPKDMRRATSKNLREVQNDLMGFINANTILIGHGLENDLRALKIVHYYVVDTAYSFPHYNGLPYRRSLKNLTSSVLKRDIQGGRCGHNSYDDASACMELMLWRVRKDFRSYLSTL